MCEGKDAIRRFFSDLSDTGPDFRVIIECLESIGVDQVLALLRVTVRGRASGIPRPHRFPDEKDAIDLFSDTMTYYGKKIADGKLTYFEPFFVNTGDLTEFSGFMIGKGPLPEIFKVVEEDYFKELNTRAYRFLDHFSWNLLTVGEGIEKQLSLYKKVAKV